MLNLTSDRIASNLIRYISGIVEPLHGYRTSYFNSFLKERLLNEYVYDATSAIFAADPAGRIIYHNRRAAELFQLDSETARTVRDCLPPELLEALSDAREAFAKSGDPRQIDLRLDRACYRAMLAAATATGEPMLAGWVRAKIDLVNVMITLRILRLSLGASAGQFLEEALLSGGSLDPDFFRAALGETGGEDNLLWRLRTTRQPLLEGLVRRMEKTDKSLSALEKCCDDTHMELVRHDARVPFGVGVPGGYLYGWETAVRNIRIILAAREAGLTPAQTRERVRESYV